MRTCDIDRTGDVWVYEPHTHKNEHHGHPRKIAIGPKAQEILEPFLKPNRREAYLFSPRKAADQVNAETETKPNNTDDAKPEEAGSED